MDVSQICVVPSQRVNEFLVTGATLWQYLRDSSQHEQRSRHRHVWIFQHVSKSWCSDFSWQIVSCCLLLICMQWEKSWCKTFTHTAHWAPAGSNGCVTLDTLPPCTIVHCYPWYSDVNPGSSLAIALLISHPIINKFKWTKLPLQWGLY